MGKTASFGRAHQRQARGVQERRRRKSTAARESRRGEAAAREARLIHRPTGPRRAPVTQEKKEMLLKQFAQACRLPAACEDLCTLLRPTQEKEEVKETNNNNNNNNNTRKRKREDGVVDETILDSVINAFLQLENQAVNTIDEDDNNDEEEPMTLLEDVIQDECGARVVCALISAMDNCNSSKFGKKKVSVLDAVMKLFEENETLYEHFIACKVMSSLVQHGNSTIQERVLQVLRHHAATIDQIRSQLRNRHSAITIQYLIKHFPTETIEWLTDTFSLNESNDQDGKKIKKKKSNKENEDKNEIIVSLILDPVASPVMRTLFLNSSKQSTLLKNIHINTLIENKRGCKFLHEILSPEIPKWTPEEATEILEIILNSCEKNILEMSTSGNSNFLLQSIIRIIPYTGENSAITYFKRILNVLESHLLDLSIHYIGVHVVISFIEATLSLSTKSLVEEVASLIITRKNVSEMLRDPNGSLIIRKLLPICLVKDSKVGKLIINAIEQDIISLMYDAIGNLTLQEYINKTNGAEEFTRKLIKNEDLLNICQHSYASHVIGCIFDHVGASTHTNLCNALRPHIITLSKHLNGRFIVEKAIRTNRDICDLILRNFKSLAVEKGTQHVLCTLMSNLDQRGKQRVVDVIISGLTELATQQSGSIVIQKLMQSDSLLQQAVKKELIQKPRLRNNLAQNFFGKFVVQISDAA